MYYLNVETEIGSITVIENIDELYHNVQKCVAYGFCA